MRYLLDTHVFIWWLTEPGRISRRATRVFRDPDSRLVWSVASSWEASIKYAIGKLKLPGTPATFFAEHLALQSIESLPIENVHAWRAAELPLHHGDPFDRLLISQALIEDLAILTADPMFKRYGVKVVW